MHAGTKYNDDDGLIVIEVPSQKLAIVLYKAECITTKKCTIVQCDMCALVTASGLDCGWFVYVRTCVKVGVALRYRI